MQLGFSQSQPATPGTLVVAAVEGTGLLAAAKRCDKESGGAVSRAAAAAGFTGKAGQILDVLAPAGLAATRLLVLGLGKADSVSEAGIETAAAAALARLMGAPLGTATFEIDSPKGAKLAPEAIAAHLAFGARLKSYTFDQYRTKDVGESGLKLRKVTVVTSDPAAAKTEFADLEAEARGIFLARDLVNEPPNVLSPVEFAKRLKALSRHGLKVEILNEAQMKKLGMGALLGVGQGSARESQLVVLQWNGARRKTQAPVAFVGKGVCFDSGGLSLKTGTGMMGMKGDMGGAAAVAGAMLTLALRAAPCNAVGVIGLVENMPDGTAQRPDDVVKTMSGQTVEVLNTDAEGRLVLADALWYAQSRFKPKYMIDLATLTGAILVALGTEHAGLFTNDDKLAELLTTAGAASGESVWRLPLGPAYDKLLKSKIADMKNIGGQYGGSITAAQFLQRFVNGTKWAHLDIAGVAWQDGEKKALVPSWGTGWGVRILNRLLADMYEG